jgi:hypothetical protein
MVNYQNGIIYKIAHRYSPYVYIGSTTNFNRRKCQHKNNCINENGKAYNFKVYQTIREMGGWDNFEMVLVAKYPCNDKKELHAKEFEYQQLFDVNMNMVYSVKSLEKIRLIQKKFREKNKEKHKEYMIKWHQENHQKELIYRKNNLEKNNEASKLWRKENPELRKKSLKKYYEKKKEELLKKQKNKVECECGMFITKGCIAKHRKRQLHLNLMSA